MSLLLDLRLWFWRGFRPKLAGPLRMSRWVADPCKRECKQRSAGVAANTAEGPLRGRRQNALHVATAALLVLSSLQIVRPATISVNGALAITRSAGGHTIPVSDWFSLSVDGTNYLIRAGSFKTPSIEYAECGLMTNGGTYVLVVFDTNAVFSEYTLSQNGRATTKKLKRPNRPLNDGMLWLDKSPAPDEAGVGMFAALRLAYVPDARLMQPGTHSSGQFPEIFPVTTGRVGQRGSAATEYTLSSAPPHLLETLVQWQDRESHPADSPHVSYSVLSWTNVGTFRVPQQFVVVRRQAVSGDSIIYEGTVSAATMHAAPVPPLLGPKELRVVERRFGDGLIPESFSYDTTNGFLWTKEQILANTNFLRSISRNEAFLRSLIQNPAPQQRPLRSTLLVRVLLLFVFAIAPIAALMWRLRRRPAGRSG